LVLVEIGGILYLLNVVLSIIFTIIIIDKLYISKKFTKEKDFHLYNDLFSWEIFYIFIGIENLMKVLSIFIINNIEISNLLLRIRILIMFFPFWNKIIHLEKVMNKITYDRHYFASIIPFFIVLMLVITNLPNFILLFFFLGTSLIPFLLFALFLKNTGTTNKKVLKVVLGAAFVGLGCMLRQEILVSYVGISKALDFFVNITNITTPILFIIGTLLIFDSFRKEVFN